MSQSELSTSLLLTFSRSKLDQAHSLRLRQLLCQYALLTPAAQRLLQVSWHQLAHCLAASAKQSAAFAEGVPTDGADDALQSTGEPQGKPSES